MFALTNVCLLGGRAVSRRPSRERTGCFTHELPIEPRVVVVRRRGGGVGVGGVGGGSCNGDGADIALIPRFPQLDIHHSAMTSDPVQTPKSPQ